jgi:hypothetical protein
MRSSGLPCAADGSSARRASGMFVIGFLLLSPILLWDRTGVDAAIASVDARKRATKRWKTG